MSGRTKPVKWVGIVGGVDPLRSVLGMDVIYENQIMDKDIREELEAEGFNPGGMTEEIFQGNVKLVKSGIQGLGIVPRRTIPMNALFLQYTGKVTRTKGKGPRKFSMLYHKTDKSTFYLDASEVGSMARYVNHVCEPGANSRIERIDANGKLYVFLRALEEIPPGVEITFDYHMGIGETERNMNCYCMGRRCRVQMGVRETRKPPELYKCKLCPKKFKDNASLRVHTNRHVGVRQYACNNCERRFADVGTRNRHMKTVHEEKPLICGFNGCTKAFARKYHLKSHREVCGMKQVRAAKKRAGKVMICNE